MTAAERLLRKLVTQLPGAGNRCIPTLLLSSVLGACSTLTPGDPARFASLTSMYDFQLVQSAERAPVDVIALARKLEDADAVFVGEYHSHQGSHLLQLELLEALHRKDPDLVLSMEQFNRDAQAVVEQYLAGKIGEEALIDEADAWDNYKGSYRPLLEFAKEHAIPVIAANAPAMHVRCVGRQGPQFLEQLPPTQRRWSAQRLDLDNPAYREKFFEAMTGTHGSHGIEKKQTTKRKARLENSFAAQLLRDTTMAESVAAAMEKYPDALVVHLTGAFHSDSRLGTVQVLENLRPGAELVVVSPVMVNDPDAPEPADDDYGRGDYLYLVRELPPRYVDEERQRQAIRKSLEQRSGADCAPDEQD